MWIYPLHLSTIDTIEGTRILDQVCPWGVLTEQSWKFENENILPRIVNPFSRTYTAFKKYVFRWYPLHMRADLRNDPYRNQNVYFKKKRDFWKIEVDGYFLCPHVGTDHFYDTTGSFDKINEPYCTWHRKTFRSSQDSRILNEFEILRKILFSGLPFRISSLLLTQSKKVCPRMLWMVSCARLAQYMIIITLWR